MEQGNKILEGILRFSSGNLNYQRKSNLGLPQESEMPAELASAAGFLSDNKKHWIRDDNDYISIALIGKDVIASRLNQAMGKANAAEYYGKSVVLSKDGALIKDEKEAPAGLLYPIHEITHNEFFQSIDDLTMKIKDLPGRFDCIVGVTRSGLIPATYLAYSLKIENLYALNVQVYAKHKDKVSFNPFEHEPGLIEGKRVLLVDNVADSGLTLDMNRKKLSEYNPASVSSCVTHYLSCTNILPDFYSKRLAEWRWVSCPWDIDLLKQKLMNEIPQELRTDEYLKKSYLFETK